MKRISKAGQVCALGVPAAASVESVGGALLIDTDSRVPVEYPFRLNTYVSPPTYDITVEQFEEYAFARLQCTTPLPSLPISIIAQTSAGSAAGR